MPAGPAGAFPGAWRRTKVRRSSRTAPWRGERGSGKAFRRRSARAPSLLKGRIWSLLLRRGPPATSGSRLGAPDPRTGTSAGKGSRRCGIFLASWRTARPTRRPSHAMVLALALSRTVSSLEHGEPSAGTLALSLRRSAPTPQVARTPRPRALTGWHLGSRLFGQAGWRRNGGEHPKQEEDAKRRRP